MKDIMRKTDKNEKHQAKQKNRSNLVILGKTPKVAQVDIAVSVTAMVQRGDEMPFPVEFPIQNAENLQTAIQKLFREVVTQQPIDIIGNPLFGCHTLSFQANVAHIDALKTEGKKEDDTNQNSTNES